MSSLYPDLPFSGSYTALITPFKDDGSLDEARFEALVDWQIEQGTDGLVPVGTTGESPTLSHEEHDRVVEGAAAGLARAPGYDVDRADDILDVGPGTVFAPVAAVHEHGFRIQVGGITVVPV